MSTPTQLQFNGLTSDLAKIEETKMEFPLRKHFTVNMPDGVISESGIEEIAYTLECHEFPPLPKDFEWVWLGRRGTLPKRIQAYYFKEHAIKLSSEIIADIGNKGRQHTSVACAHILDFTNRVDWSHGEYGDSGSCFWGDKNGAREMIEDNGLAIRAYRRSAGFDPEKTSSCRGLTGYARAWIGTLRDNRLIVFNGYGETTLTFARILALKFNCAYKRITLTNMGSDDGVLWINGGTGYMVGQFAKIDGVTSHDFGWREIEDHSYWCEVCESRIDGEDHCMAYTARGHEVICCSDCASRCDRCEEYYTYNLEQLEHEYFCRECFETTSQEIAERKEVQA